jgi:hypothetical protein
MSTSDLSCVSDVVLDNQSATDNNLMTWKLSQPHGSAFAKGRALAPRRTAFRFSRVADDSLDRDHSLNIKGAV